MLAHKFGMGKNLGLGSLQVKIVSAILLNIPGRYRSFTRSGEQRDADDVKNTLAGAYWAFVKRIYPIRPAPTLWGNQRMRAFAALLSWKPQISAENTRQIPIDVLLSKDSSRLVKQLKVEDASEDALTPYLKEQLSDATKRLLSAYQEGRVPPVLKQAFHNDLTRLVNGGPLYAPERFAHVCLKPRTSDLVNENPQGQRLTNLNWTLLEEAYPSEDIQWKDRYCLPETNVLATMEKLLLPADVFPPIKISEKSLATPPQVNDVVLGRILSKGKVELIDASGKPLPEKRFEQVTVFPLQEGATGNFKVVAVEKGKISRIRKV